MNKIKNKTQYTIRHGIITIDNPTQPYYRNTTNRMEIPSKLRIFLFEKLYKFREKTEQLEFTLGFRECESIQFQGWNARIWAISICHPISDQFRRKTGYQIVKCRIDSRAKKVYRRNFIYVETLPKGDIE